MSNNVQAFEKSSSAEIRLSITIMVPRLARVCVGLGSLAAALVGRGVEPGLAWSTNLAARVFAVDSQTNVYANAGGNARMISGGGLVLQTNPICPLPGFARRDGSGNYYFGGSFDGT